MLVSSPHHMGFQSLKVSDTIFPVKDGLWIWLSHELLNSNAIFFYESYPPDAKGKQFGMLITKATYPCL